MTELQIIERSIITTYRSRIWSKFTKAVKEFSLINENDKVCVCISGGKDSIILAKLVQELHRHSKIHFEVKFLVMNPGFSQENLDKIVENLKLLGIPAIVKNTNIFDIIAKEEGKIACYLCAKMRRGALYSFAHELGCNKIALGHHYDDVIETVVLNLLNAGTFQTMVPKLRSQNFEDMELIRPMVYIREDDIISWGKYNNIVFPEHMCRFTEKNMDSSLISQRKKTKELLKVLSSYNPVAEKNIFTATKNVVIEKVLGCKYKDKKYDFNDIFNNFNSPSDN